MLAFGNLGVQGGSLNVQGWLYDTKNPQSPQVLGKQYREEANDANARLIAHRFADEIILRLGGGVAGIAETKLYFVSNRSGSKEIWQMDYDGANQKQLTHMGSIALSPHVSPDGTRVAYSGVTKDGWQILMYSLELGRGVNFQHFGGDNYSPAWSSDGQTIAFSSSRSGNTEIYSVSSAGGNARRLTESKGPDVSPTWNPKTNAQIAWVSGRTGLPQIYTMASDGTNVVRDDRSGLCRIAVVVAERAVPGVRVDTPLWPGRTRRQRHLRHGYCQQTMGATDPRRRAQRFSVVVARWTAHRVSVEPHRPRADLFHARRWKRSAAIDDGRGKYAAELEFQVALGRARLWARKEHTSALL